MKLAFLLVCLFLVPAELSAADGGFVSVDGRKVFVRHEKAAAGAPTLVLLNGLTYSTKQWDSFANALRRLKPGIGILRYDMTGMGKTLLEGPLPVNYSISYQGQAAQLKKLLEKLGLKKVDLAGLSYGGAIALAFAQENPGSVNRLFLMAPFTEPLAEQDRLIRTQVAATRLAFPFNPATDDELYDFFLRQFIYQNYPLSEPVILENPYKLEAVFRMVQGIRSFRAKDAVKGLPPASVHLMVASQDQYIPGEVLNVFWKAVPKAARATRLDISYSEHKIPEAVPYFAAAWITTVLEQDLKGEYEGNSWAFRAVSGSKVIELPRP